MHLSTESCAKVLKELAQLDVDAVFAYEQALEQIEESEIHEAIKSFKEDHLRHIEDLNRHLKNMGENPVEKSQDFKGFLIEGFTMVRALTGTQGALKAMESNEKTTNKSYKCAIKDNPDLPEEIMALLQKNYEDEKRHLDYIEKTLSKWDKQEER